MTEKGLGSQLHLERLSEKGEVPARDWLNYAAKVTLYELIKDFQPEEVSWLPFQKELKNVLPKCDEKFELCFDASFFKNFSDGRIR